MNQCDAIYTIVNFILESFLREKRLFNMSFSDLSNFLRWIKTKMMSRIDFIIFHDLFYFQINSKSIKIVLLLLATNYLVFFLQFHNFWQLSFIFSNFLQKYNPQQWWNVCRHSVSQSIIVIFFPDFCSFFLFLLRITIIIFYPHLLLTQSRMY